MTADFTASESPHTVPYKEEWVHCEQLKCKFWPYINLDHIDCTQLDTNWFCANPGNNSQSIVRSSSCPSLMAHLPRCFDKSGLGWRWLPPADYGVSIDIMRHLPILCPIFSIDHSISEFQWIALCFLRNNCHFPFLLCKLITLSRRNIATAHSLLTFLFKLFRQSPFSSRVRNPTMASGTVGLRLQLRRWFGARWVASQFVVAPPPGLITLAQPGF